MANWKQCDIDALVVTLWLKVNEYKRNYHIAMPHISNNINPPIDND